MGAGDDAGVGAKRVQLAEAFGVAEFACVAGGENEADARDAGEHGVGGGGEDVGGIGAEFEGVAVKALIEVDGGDEGALEGGDAVGGWRQGFAPLGSVLGNAHFFVAIIAMIHNLPAWLDRYALNTLVPRIM